MSPAHKGERRHGGSSPGLNVGAGRELAREDVTANPVLVEVTRSNWVESVHRGSIVMINSDASVRVLGDATVPVYPRSSLKPLQATAMLTAGLRVTEEQLALVAASHSGTPAQVEVARSILASVGLTEDALRCPPALPDAEADIEDFIRSGGTADRIHHNCSGKHSGMVATCVVNGWPTEGYLENSHPLQKQIRASIEQTCAEAVGGTGVDGCGAPVHLLSLPALARGYSALTTSHADLPAGRVAAAMRARPDLVGGPGRDVSEMMAACPGLLAKEGAEAVWAAALPDGRAFAARLDDGALRALPPVLAAVARAWGYEGPVIDRWVASPTLGGGQPVGVVRPSPELIDWLTLAD